MSNYLNKIVYLTDEQYTSLINAGSITKNGTTYHYDQNTLYITDTDLATTSPSAQGTATEFITSISQDKYGKISATKASLNTSGTWSGTATIATNVAWSGITNNPVSFLNDSYGTTGWQQLGGKASSQSSIIVSKPTDTVTWGTAAHSAAIAFGCGDTKGMIDLSYNSPDISIAGGNASGSTNSAPKWYFKLSATSGQKYTFPSTSKTLAAADGSNASGTNWAISITGSAGKLSNTAAIGSDVKPVYFTNQGVPQAISNEVVQAFLKTSSSSAQINLNTLYDSGFYSIPGGYATNYAAGGSGYANIITAAYRKPSGNTKTDYAWQLGNFTNNNDRMWYRTSTDSSWRAWRQIVNIAANTSVGNENTPVYIDANGEVQQCNAYSSVSVNQAENSDKIAAKLAATTKTYLLGTSTTLTASAANVELSGDNSVYLTTTAGELSAVRHSYNSSGTEKAYTVYNTTDDSIDFVFI